MAVVADVKEGGLRSALHNTELQGDNYANEGVRFQGFPGRVLIIVDEAPGGKTPGRRELSIRSGRTAHGCAVTART